MIGLKRTAKIGSCGTPWITKRKCERVMMNKLESDDKEVITAGILHNIAEGIDSCQTSKRFFYCF